jgi:hypothetical protein
MALHSWIEKLHGLVCGFDDIVLFFTPKTVYNPFYSRFRENQE